MKTSGYIFLKKKNCLLYTQLLWDKKSALNVANVTTEKRAVFVIDFNYLQQSYI